MLQSLAETLFVNKGDYTALNSFTAEATLLTKTPVQQPWLRAGYFDGQGAEGKLIRIRARGVLGSTGTPSYTFLVRLGTTAALDIAGAAVWKSPAIVIGSGVTTKIWALDLDIQCTAYEFVLAPGGAESATWTNTIDSLLTYYISLSAISTASDTLNTITCKHLSVEALN